MSTKLAITLLPILLTGCVTTELRVPSSLDAKNDLTGCWQGDQNVLSGDHQKWVRCLNENGQYRIDFTTIFGSGTTNSYQEGRWSYSNGIYTTIIFILDGENENPLDKINQGVYIVKSVTDEKMEYISLRTGNDYVAYRIHSKN